MEYIVYLGFFLAILGFGAMVWHMHVSEGPYRFEYNFMERRSDGTWVASPFAFGIMLTLLLQATAVMLLMVRGQPFTELLSIMSGTFGVGQLAQRGISATKDVLMPKEEKS